MEQTAKDCPIEPSVLHTVRDLRDYVEKKRIAGCDIALVPTMGALHEGHLELVRQGLDKAGCVIVSIFVNPAQFGEGEDFDAYPGTRPGTREEDLKKLAKIGTHAVFSPDVSEIYPEGFSTTVSVSGISEGLCGGVRPGHFDGVATVVAKLLLQCRPDIALFGEKDYQQLQVIRRMNTDLDIGVEIIGVPTVRDENGLALSSRNAYLDERQYKIATELNKTLFAMAGKISSGERLRDVRSWGLQALENAGFESVDYLDICDAQTLKPKKEKKKNPLRILAAVRLRKARLIDNVPA